MKFKQLIVAFLFALAVTPANAQHDKVPGVIVDYLPASSQKYIGSPSICILPNGDYVASHDYFGPSSSEHQRAVTAIFRSSNKGKSWSKISEINGQFWSNLFFHQNALYIMGTWKHHGNLIIRKSTDGGVTWTVPVDKSSDLLLEGEYHTAPVPMVVHNGRLWRAVENAKSDDPTWGKRYSAMVISAPENADLLNADNWVASNFLPFNATYLDGKFGGWLEGNVVVTPEGKIIDFLRVASSEKSQDMAAIVTISDDGKKASFDSQSGFFDFAGGSRKFTIRYDETTHRYWTLSNFVTDEFKSLAAASVRNTLVLKSSSDLKNWTIHKILLHHPDVKKHGFQYVDWQFEGRNIIFLSRTAFDDKFGGANNYHDANFLTFHRIKNFRKYKK